MNVTGQSSKGSSGKESDAASEKEDITSSPAARYALQSFEKCDRYECQELLAYTASHWMLSSDDFRIPTDPPFGLASEIPALSNSTAFLIPVDPNINPMDMRELHQIIRELTVGIYSLNQMPCCALEPNFDQSTSCQIPPAYIDTKVGQIMINVDYMMKALWHGAYFPKEKRTKFTERWRTNLDVNSNGKPETRKLLSTEFSTAGMLDITKDPDYAHVYDHLPEEQPNDTDLIDERRFFMSNVDDLSMQMTLYQKSVQMYKNLFVVDSDWIVGTIVRLTEDRIDHGEYERLNARLLLHQQIIKQNLANKLEVRRQIALLKVIGFLTPLLVGMRKRMKIPDVNQLLVPLIGDDVRTERELPPLIVGNDFKCKNFTFQNQYFHLHGGIQIDHHTDSITDTHAEVATKYDDIIKEAWTIHKKWTNPELPRQESYPLSTVEINGSKYWIFCLDFETFYPQAPQKPTWVHAMNEEVVKLKPRRLPLQDVHTHEQFKKYFGYKKAIKYKTLPNGLRAASQRGLVSMFMTLGRKCPPARLAKQDEYGLSLIHHAAMYNRPQIIACLILQSIDANVRRYNVLQSTGPTALHLAARCGALDAVSCLLANYANIFVTDQDGWAPVHHAAFFDHEQVVKLFVRKHPHLLELPTNDDLHSTPLLLASSSGALNAVRCLISIGANITSSDSLNNNMVHLSALRFHTNVLDYFIKWNHPDVPVWKLLVGMLNDVDLCKKDSAVKCLEPLSTSDPHHWTCILEADGVQALVGLLNLEHEELQSVAASVLCNISEHEQVRKALTKANAAETLIRLLASPIDDIQSRAAIVLADLACVDDNQASIAEKGGIVPLVNLLDSELEDVLVNSVNAIRVLCDNNPENQTSVARNNGIEPLVEFLTVNSDMLQAASAAALAAMTKGHRVNQDAVVSEGAVKPLVDLIKGRNVTVQVKAASALEALADNNPDSQKAFLDLDAPKALIKLLKIWSVEVREQGALALWSLAGDTRTQQKYIAERIGILQLIEILLINSEKLQYVGCMALIALGRENMDNQKKICKESGIQPLVRLIRSGKASPRVLHMAIRTLGTLCVGVAHRNNKMTQKQIAEENTMPILVNLLMNPPSDEIEVEVACAIGCIVLGNPDNQELLSEQPAFRLTVLLQLLHSKREEIRLKAGHALTIFAFNNTPQQFAIREAGGIRFSVFQPYLESQNEFFKCSAAFQVVVLARVIVDMDQVTLTALGVTTLVETLNSLEDNAIILAASLMSSLAHTRAGIPDAMITTGGGNLLVKHLHSDSEQVRSAAAVALGYLSYNRTAARHLLSACRNDPGLYEQLMENIGPNPKINPEFVDDFRRAKIVGLPSQSLEINGGPPVVPPVKKVGKRPKTSHILMREKQREKLRAASAPAHMQRHLGRGFRPASHGNIPASHRNIPVILVESQAAKNSQDDHHRAITKTDGPVAKTPDVVIDSPFKSSLTESVHQ